MILYRAIVENLCDDEDYLKSTIYLNYEEYSIFRMTKCFWIIKVNGKYKKVGKNSKNKFATCSKEKALMDAWHRNRRYASILNAKLAYANRVRDFIKEQFKKD